MMALSYVQNNKPVQILGRVIIAFSRSPDDLYAAINNDYMGMYFITSSATGVNEGCA
jgi:hypothetical protein